MKELQIDENRIQHDGVTGIYIRAQGPDGKWDSYDIAQLDRDSLAEFSRSRGEVSDWGMSLIWHLLGHPMQDPEVVSTPIYKLDLSVRTLNCLRRHGIETIEQLCQKRWSELLDMSGFGRGSLEEVQHELALRGLALKDVPA